MSDIVDRLRDYQESWADSIKRMDCGEFDNGIMTQIRLAQHDAWKSAADTIESLRKQVAELSTDWQVQHAKVMELEKECSKLRHEEVRLLNQGIEKNARIAELREAFDLIYSWANNWDSEFMNDPDWKNVDFPKIQDIVTRTDDTSALEAFRNKVLDEVAEEMGACGYLSVILAGVTEVLKRMKR